MSSDHLVMQRSDRVIWSGRHNYAFYESLAVTIELMLPFIDGQHAVKSKDLPPRVLWYVQKIAKHFGITDGIKYL